MVGEGERNWQSTYSGYKEVTSSRFNTRDTATSSRMNDRGKEEELGQNDIISINT